MKVFGGHDMLRTPVLLAVVIWISGVSCNMTPSGDPDQNRIGPNNADSEDDGSVEDG